MQKTGRTKDTTKDAVHNFLLHYFFLSLENPRIFSVQATMMVMMIDVDSENEICKEMLTSGKWVGEEKFKFFFLKVCFKRHREREKTFWLLVKSEIDYWREYSGERMVWVHFFWCAGWNIKCWFKQILVVVVVKWRVIRVGFFVFWWPFAFDFQ